MAISSHARTTNSDQSMDSSVGSAACNASLAPCTSHGGRSADSYRGRMRVVCCVMASTVRRGCHNLRLKHGMRLRCRPRPPIVEKRAECCPAILIGCEPASAVSDSSEGCAHALAAGRVELSESPRQQRLRHCSEVVERHRALVFDPLFWAHRHTGRNVSDGACHRRHNHVVEHGNGLVSGHHKRWPRLLIRGLEQPQLALSYHGSASVMAIAFARAAASSAGPCGMCRYDAAIASPSRARLIESAKWSTACRTTSDRFVPMPAATRRSMTSVCCSLKRVGIGVVIQSVYELLYAFVTARGGGWPARCTG